MTFSEQFIQVMDEVLNKVGIMVDWTSQSVVPYLTDFAERFIQYQIFTNVLIGVSSIVALIFFSVMTLIGIKRKWEARLALFGTMAVITVFLCIVFLPDVVREIAQAVFIPEMIIIEELMTLIQ